MMVTIFGSLSFGPIFIKRGLASLALVGDSRGSGSQLAEGQLTDP